jgi:methionine-rich copper-binding protein CopC
MKISRFFPHLIVFSLLITGLNRAQAHAFLDHAEPAVGAQISQSPAQVKIWFTEDVEPAFSVIQVADASGKPIDKKDTHLDPQNKAILLVSLPTLTPGTYKVSWKVVAEDTHHTQGNFSFVLKP